jgi:hypothetical protein
VDDPIEKIIARGYFETQVLMETPATSSNAGRKRVDRNHEKSPTDIYIHDTIANANLETKTTNAPPRTRRIEGFLKRLPNKTKIARSDLKSLRADKTRLQSPSRK